jgi:hypothetical protein
MSKEASPKIVIGRVEKISFPDLGIFNVHAKVDTGADLSSLWAVDVKERDGVLSFKLFGRQSEYHTGQSIRIEEPHYLLTRIANSFGHKEMRYVVKLQVKIGKRLVRSSFTLADRSKKTYPILIGRKLLNQKFIVDVSKGSPLKEVEDAKKKRLEKEIEVFRLWEKKA